MPGQCRAFQHLPPLCDVLCVAPSADEHAGETADIIWQFQVCGSALACRSRSQGRETLVRMLRGVFVTLRYELRLLPGSERKAC